MKRFNYFSSVLMTACFALALTACNKDNTTPEEDGLSGIVTEDMVLDANQTYYLSGSLQVKAPATLTIKEGARLVARNNGEVIYILVEQGAKIDAQGTAENPIVMTAEKEAEGAWGGLHICGKAHTNLGANGGMSEIGNAPYGGNDDDDNSGILKYVRLEYTGYAFDEEHESNGISLYGVGSGTTISYVQTYVGSDDGIEFFGGSVNVDHCVVVNCTDDSFDWTEGWNGTAHHLVAYQGDPTCDCLMECDNNGDNEVAEPFSHPNLSYVTLIGNNSTENSRGVRLRAGTEVTLDNAVITGKPHTINVETAHTQESLADNTSKLTNITMTGDFRNENETPSYDQDDFVSAGNIANASFEVTDRYYTPGKGAFETSTDWTEGWTR